MLVIYETVAPQKIDTETIPVGRYLVLAGKHLSRTSSITPFYYKGETVRIDNSAVEYRFETKLDEAALKKIFGKKFLS